MNSKNVLGKILTMLSLADEKLIQAKTDDGEILQSSNFDVNDDVECVNADGTTTPAEDGLYTITFTTPEGNESTQVIDIDGGKIAQISTPEEAADVANGTDDEDEQMDAPTAPESPMMPVSATPGVPASMAEQKVTDSVKPVAKEKAKSLPNTTDENEVNVHKDGDEAEQDGVIRMEDLSARLQKMEDTISDMMTKLGIGDVKPDNVTEPSHPVIETEKDLKFEEEELPKLDGAPLEQATKFSEVFKPTTFGKKVGNSQSSFLSKLYN
jgi:hypothetical protein